MKPRIKWMFLLLVVTVLFFWKISLTNQFSIFTEYEGANQVYAWDNFSAATLKQGALPIWDPYTHSGRSFVGEMQTGLFYPPKVLLYLWPFNRSGLISLKLLHNFFVLGHFLAGCFMFLLAVELGLNSFAAFVASICFALGGFVGRVNWPDMLDTTIWLPLVFLFVIRALRSAGTVHGVLAGCLAGLWLGVAILAGRLHVVMMDVLVVVSAAAYFALRSQSTPMFPLTWRQPWVWSATVVALVGVTSFSAGAVQLLPSVEYSGRATRYLSADLNLPTTQKIPYLHLSDGFTPRAVAGFLFGHPFGGADMGGEYFTPYLGVMPLLLVIIGIWRNWDHPWVRYLAGLGGVAFFYSLGAFSFLHGLLYALVPYLWLAREPGRFIYLTHFAMAVLAGFGAQSLFSEAPGKGTFDRLARFLKWLVTGVAAALAIPALYGKPEMNEWVYLSFFFIVATYALFVHILRAGRTPMVQFLVVALILCDLNGFRWGLHNKEEEQKLGRNYLEALLGCRNVVNFIKSQKGLFRVQMQVDAEPNIGDLYGVQTTGGMSATLLTDYKRFLDVGPRGNDLLNVRYVITAKPTGETAPVYRDEKWFVYENPTYLPRAWVVHQVVTEPSLEAAVQRVAQTDFDPLRTALLAGPLDQPLEAAESLGEVKFDHYQAHRVELTVSTASRGLLVLSEVYYPGWRATVDGKPARIHRVNGLLRGIDIPAGTSKVKLRYLPLSFVLGAVLAGLAFFGVLTFAAILPATWNTRNKRALTSPASIA